MGVLKRDRTEFECETLARGHESGVSDVKALQHGVVATGGPQGALSVGFGTARDAAANLGGVMAAASGGGSGNIEIVRGSGAAGFAKFQASGGWQRKRLSGKVAGPGNGGS
jgi:hypothetical protein